MHFKLIGIILKVTQKFSMSCYLNEIIVGQINDIISHHVRYLNMAIILTCKHSGTVMVGNLLMPYIP